MKRYTRLVLVFTAIVTMMCRCYIPFDYNTVLYSNNSMVECKGFRDSASGGTPAASGYRCPLPCPDGSVAHFDVFGSDPSDPIEKLQAQYCTAAATPTATVPPSSAKAATPTVPSQNRNTLAPVLDGKVSACDTGQGFINFSLSSQAGDLTGKQLIVSLNGTEVKCAVAGSQKQLLGCSLPTGLTFPASVKVVLDGNVVNEFSYDGAGCTNSAQTGGQGGSSEPAAQPTASD